MFIVLIERTDKQPYIFLTQYPTRVAAEQGIVNSDTYQRHLGKSYSIYEICKNETVELRAVGEAAQIKWKEF